MRRFLEDYPGDPAEKWSALSRVLLASNEFLFLKRPQWEFQPHGQCGTEVSTLFPHVAKCVDDIALIRSMHTSHSNHYNATLGMHTGSFAFSRPSIGSWMTYWNGHHEPQPAGLRRHCTAQTYAGTQVYASDFLPALFRGRSWFPGPTRSPMSVRAFRLIISSWSLRRCGK